jgi:hypothetical protein
MSAISVEIIKPYNEGIAKATGVKLNSGPYDAQIRVTHTLSMGDAIVLFQDLGQILSEYKRALSPVLDVGTFTDQLREMLPTS